MCDEIVATGILILTSLIFEMAIFAHPQHYFTAASENDKFEMADNSFRLNQSLLIWIVSPPDFTHEGKQKF